MNFAKKKINAHRNFIKHSPLLRHTRTDTTAMFISHCGLADLLNHHQELVALGYS